MAKLAAYSSVAKYDSQSSRMAAIEVDEAMEDFYRPEPSSKAGPGRPPRSNPKTPASKTPMDLDDEARDESFLRSRRRVPMRRGVLPRNRKGRIIFAVVACLILGVTSVLAYSTYRFLRTDSRLRINSASNIQVFGNSEVTRPELLSIFGSDIGRNIFFVPLADRRAALEKLPWVEHAAVMRLLPNQIRVSIVERVPIAFVRTGTTVRLIDATGALLTLSPSMIAAKHYSFPVVTGIQADDPPELRAARMHLYNQFISSLDSGGGNVSAKLSEVDLSDPEDIRAILPSNGSDILVHFGDSNFLNRYQRYQKHLDEWLRQYPKLASVDLRYENQVVLGMSKDGLSGPGALSGQAAKSQTAVAAQGSVSHSSSRAKGTKPAKAGADHHAASHHANVRPAAARHPVHGEHRPAKKATHGNPKRSKG